MMKHPNLPDYVTPVTKDELFNFDCHPGVPCFTHCCRELELALTPYDILRLRKATGLHSRELLEKYVIIEQGCQDVFPRLYLTMVDDGQASCVFVSKEGCTVYEHRPGACRAYPTGRGAQKNSKGMIEELHVLLREDHCKGFEESASQNVVQYMRDQELDTYNHFNDKVAQIFQHEQIRAGKVFTKPEINHLTLALYDIDTFRERIFAGNLPEGPQLNEQDRSKLQDDEELLCFAIDWVLERFFPEQEKTP